MRHRELVVDRSDAASDGASTFEKRVSLLSSRFTNMWQATSDTFAPFGRTFGLQEQRETEARVREMMLKNKALETDTEENTLLRMKRLKTSVQALVTRSVEPRYREETRNMLDQFSDAGDEFVRRAREFDPDLEPEDVFQALRNVWIINSMQVAFDIPVRLTPSGLAYSLLYPYTDNFLDHAKVPRSEKEEFNRSLARRLSGTSVPPASQLAARVSDLVGMIESEYARESCPVVYESLLAIHRAQERSLVQRGGDPACRIPSSILRVSVEKGGTSVLADAYLAKGWLTPLETEFAFGYGVFLQFIDDLQDLRGDTRSGHQTLFTAASREGALDGWTNRLVRFIKEVLASSDFLALPHAVALAELMETSCCYLVLESIALHSTSFTNRYVEAVEAFSPMRFDSIRELHAEMRAKQKRARKAFARKRLISSRAPSTRPTPAWTRAAHSLPSN